MMAVRGRKPKPAEQKRATGNPGKRAIPAEPVFESGEIPPADWLNPVELEEWERIVPELVRLNIAKPIHRGALEGICSLYGAWREAREARDATGMRMTYDAYRKALNEFGLTAASAARVGGTGEDGNKDPADEFFTGPRAVAS